MSDRDELGRFGPGNKFARHNKGADTVAAIHKEFPPERVVGILDDALVMAKRQNSPRNMVLVAKTIISYTVGEPIKRVVTQSDGYDKLFNLVKELRDEQQREEKEVVVVVPDDSAKHPDD